MENRLVGNESGHNSEGVSIVQVGDVDGLDQDAGTTEPEERSAWALPQSEWQGWVIAWMCC